jgi:hypothetical protein
MKWPRSATAGWAIATLGPILLATGFSTAFAADSPLVGAWQLDAGQSGQTGLYLFTPTRYSMVLAATDRPDIADMSKATTGELRAILGPLLANAGTYEVSGDLITLHPVVAKSAGIPSPRDVPSESSVPTRSNCGVLIRVRPRATEVVLRYMLE